MLPVRLELDGSIYEYQKHDKVGYWVCVKGRIPGATSRSSVNMVVPLLFSNKLVAVAVANGADKSLFSSSPVAKKPASVTKGAKVRNSSQRSKGFGIRIFEDS
jgi:hypothetical protein